MKLDAIFEKFNRVIDGEEIRKLAIAYRQYPLQLSYSSYNDGIEFIKDRYAQAGLQAEKIQFPADGETVYADRHFPLAWDVEEAWAEIDGWRIADYAANPYSLVPFSAASGGICEKQMILLEDCQNFQSLNDYAVLITHMPTQSTIETLMAKGCKVFLAAVDLQPVDVSLEDSRRWYNDLFGAGQIDYRSHTCVGFSLTPRIARMLSAQLVQGDTRTVRYLSRTRTYAGNVQAVTAVIRGETSDCYFVTAHAYEPHATNNVAGVAACIVAAQAIQHLIDAGQLARPKYTIRFFHGLENFSLYAWGMQHQDLMKNAIGGTSMDSFGRYGVGEKREKFVLRRCLNVHPSNQHAIAREILEKVCNARSISYETREASSNNEDLMQDPDFGPPWNLLYGSLWEEPRETYPRCYFYHTDVDTPEQLSPAMLSGAAVYAATLAYYMASGGDPAEAESVAFQDWKAIVDQKCMEALQLQDVDRAFRTVRGQRLALWRDLALESGKKAIGNERLAREFASFTVSRVGAALEVLCGGEPPKLARDQQDDIVIQRLIPGPIGLGTITEDLREQLVPVLGYYSHEYWCLDPSGANLYFFDGKKSVFQVACAAWATRIYQPHEELDGLQQELARWRGLANVLLESNLDRKVTAPTVTKVQIIDGLHRLGVRNGDILMVHSSLKSLGTVVDGPDGVIDALLECVLPDGIVAMPAFTDCTDGSAREAFSAENSPSEKWIGLICETFRQREGVLRSEHPTHSVAALGKRSAEFLRQQDPYDCFAEDGPWGKLYKWQGKVLFIGPVIGSNTLLHACEAWFNGYLDETYARVQCDGKEETLVRVTNYPGGCRGGWYKLGKQAAYYKELEHRGVFRETVVGSASLTICDARQLVDAMGEIFEKDPHILLHRSGCRECARIRGKKLRARRKEQ